MAQLRTRAAAFAIATLVVAGLMLAAISARFVLTPETRPEPVAVLSEIARAPDEAPTPPPRHEPRRQEPNIELPAPVEPLAAHSRAGASEAAVTISDPVWIARPSNPESFYPRRAFMRGIEGHVELDCVVELDGRLGCAIETETPGGEGFGDAALSLAHAHVMQPAARDGARVRGRYRMVVPFSVH